MRHVLILLLLVSLTSCATSAVAKVNVWSEPLPPVVEEGEPIPDPEPPRLLAHGRFNGDLFAGGADTIRLEAQIDVTGTTVYGPVSIQAGRRWCASVSEEWSRSFPNEGPLPMEFAVLYQDGIGWPTLGFQGTMADYLEDSAAPLSAKEPGPQPEITTGPVVPPEV